MFLSVSAMIDGNELEVIVLAAWITPALSGDTDIDKYTIFVAVRPA